MSKIKYFIFLILLLFPLFVLALEYPTNHYSNAIIYDLTDSKTLYELNSNEKVSVASLTKILTVITAIENINNFNTKITYTKEMQSLVRYDTSKAGLKIGDEITYMDLLYATMLPSGADAATALALSVKNNISEFVSLMNEKAKNLGMTNSSFTNVVGLDDTNHYSTASDILKVLTYALKNPTFKSVYTSKEYTLSNGLKVASTLNIYNKNVNLDTSRIIGSKTGYTSKANLCISTLVESNNHEILIITLNTPKTNDYYLLKDILKLIDFLDDNYNNQIIYTTDNTIKTIKVLNSKNLYYIKPSKNVYAYLPNDYQKKDIKAAYLGKEIIHLKDFQDSKIGIINYYYQDNLIYSENVYIDLSTYRNKLLILIILSLVLTTTLISKIISPKKMTEVT